MRINRYLTLLLLQEKRRRIHLKRNIIAALDSQFDRQETAIVKRGIVYSSIAKLTGCNNNNTFKITVRGILKELGINAICTHKNNLFKGIANEGSVELRRRITITNSQQAARARAKQSV